MQPQSCTITYIPSLILDFNDAERRSTTKTLGENKICTLKRSKFVHNLTHHREVAPPNPSFCSPRSSHRFLNLDWIQVEDSDNRSRGLMNVKALNIHSEVSIYFPTVNVQSIHTYTLDVVVSRYWIDTVPVYICTFVIPGTEYRLYCDITVMSRYNCYLASVTFGAVTGKQDLN